MIRTGNEQILREYRINSQTNLSASTALQMNFADLNGIQRLILKARGDNIIFNFGGSGVAASSTVAANKLTDGNFSVDQGMAMSLDFQGQSQAWVSVINESQSTGALAIIQVCALPF